MVEAGTLEITGSINTTDIENGFSRINIGFKEMDANAKSSFASFNRLEGTSKSLAGSFVKIATVGVTALTAMAALSPAVAPALARMEVGFRKISFSLGRTLQPIFETMATQLIPAIGTAVDRLSPQLSGFFELMNRGFSEFATNIATLIPEPTAAESDKFGAFAETASAISGAEGEGTFKERAQALGEQGVVKGLGGLIGSGSQILFNAFIDMIEWVSAKANDKDKTYASPNQIIR